MQYILTILIALFFLQIVPAQQFTRLSAGDLVHTPSASRSANFVDVNGDGWDDIFISNGPSAGQNNFLYLNNQDGTFTTVTDDPIVQDLGKSDGASFADMDNDGDLDAMVVTWYGQNNFLYRNKGDGSFEYLDDSPACNINSFSETAAWGDVDNDGWVDLYVTNSSGMKRNLLFQNDGTGALERVAAGALVLDARTSRSADWIDYDGDGDTDLFVTNEGTEKNHLFRNDNGTYVKITDNTIVEIGRNSTGSSWGDVDNDGDFDLFVANFQNQDNQLFINEGGGNFTAISTGDIVTDGGCSFGSAFADYDNDGDLDLFVCNAFCTGEENFFYRNENGTFQRITDEPMAMDQGWTFGCAWGDINNDGYLDLALANCKDENQNNALYQNQGGNNNWLKINCLGLQSNAAGLGAIVRAKAQIGDNVVWQTRRITGQSGYCSQNSLTVHFGLNTATLVDSLIIEWPSGWQDTMTNIAVNQQCVAREGQGIGCGTTAIESAEAVHDLQLKITPNPIHDSILYYQFQSPQARDIHVSVSDVNGKAILLRSKKNAISGLNEWQLPIPSLAAGVYFLKLEMEIGEAVRQFVVKR